MVEAATGTVVSSQRFDSFGLRTATGPLLQRYGFTGREHDAESGLIYFRARSYDPAIGMFLQRDPIGFAAGDMNLYAYVENNPFNWTDPSGLGAQSAALTAGVIMMGMAAIGSAGCVVTEPCRNEVSRAADGLMGAFINLLGRIIGDALFSQGNDSSGSGGSESGGSDGAGSGAGTGTGEQAGPVPGATQHPDGPKRHGKQAEKEGGRKQAEKDFEEATGGQYEEIGGGKLRGIDSEGNPVIFNPESSGKDGTGRGGPVTIYWGGWKTRYPE